MLRCVSCSHIMRDWRTITTLLRRVSIVTTAKKNSSSSSLLSSSSRILNLSPWVTEGHCRRGVTGSVTCLAPSRPSSRGDVSSPWVSPEGSSEDGQEGQGHFGALSADVASRSSYRKSSVELQNARYQEDDDDRDVLRAEGDEAFRSRGTNTTYWYFLQCKKLIKANKLQEALDVFSRDMLKGERLQPEEYNYTILIGGCGRAGRLKNAFKLYNDMKKRGLVPTDATYTALFNACAQSPHKEAGLQRALQLEQELRRKNHPLSTITYHALLKTHAMTNHLLACLHTMREMLQNGHAVTQETFHYLLMGCLKDTNTGFRLSLQVWRQMLMSGISPDYRNYNLLLRTARDCGIGEPALASDLLLSPPVWAGQRGGDDTTNTESGGGRSPIDVDLLEKQLFIQPSPHSDRSTGQQDDSLHGLDSAALLPGAQEEPGCSGPGGSVQLVPAREAPNDLLPSGPLEADSVGVPNLLDVFEGKSRGGLVSLGTVAGPSDRLALIGGAQGVLEKMAAEGLRPDIRTLTLLADTTEPGGQSLQTLLQAAKQHKVRLDAGFFHSVMRRAARAGDMDSAKAVVCAMKQRGFSVDVRSYGCLALGCERQADGLQLLSDMQEAGLRPNVQVFSALIGQAARRLDYVYLKELLKSMRDLGVWPNEVVIRQLEFASQYPPNYDKYKTRNNYLVQIDGFRGYYQEWLMTMPAQSTEPGPESEHIEGTEAETQEEEETSQTSQEAQPQAERVTMAQRMAQRSQQEAAQSRSPLPKRDQREAATSRSHLPKRDWQEAATSRSQLPKRDRREADASRSHLPKRDWQEAATSRSHLPKRDWQEAATSRSQLPKRSQQEAATSRSHLPKRDWQEAAASRSPFPKRDQREAATSRSHLPKRDRRKST